MNNDKVTLLHLLSATAKNNSTNNERDIAVAEKPTVEYTTSNAKKEDLISPSIIERSTNEIVEEEMPLIEETSENVNLKAASDSLLEDVEMEEFASNTAPIFIPKSEVVVPVEEVVMEEEEVNLADDNYLDDPDNFDTEDIDEAYRQRLIALGLEDVEPIEEIEEEVPTTLESVDAAETIEEEIAEETTEELDDALSNVFANPPVVPAAVETQEDTTPTHFSPLDFSEDEKLAPSATASNKAADKATMLQQFRQLQDRNSTFVFMFGRQQAGKTVILSSLAYHMGVDENGLLETRRRVDNLKGAAYLKQLSQSVRKGQFMNRTAVGSLYELDLTYTPNKPETPMNFTFLEMSGEDLTKVELSESSAGQLPNDIDVYLKCPNLNLVFMMVVPYEDAEEHDYLVIDFLDYLKERKPDLDYSKVLLLISKWDRYEGLRKDEVDVFVKEQMPRTYSRLKAKKSTIARYSVGEVSDDGQQIVELNTERPEVIKKWLYKAITGQKIKNEAASIWNRFKKWV